MDPSAANILRMASASQQSMRYTEGERPMMLAMPFKARSSLLRRSSTMMGSKPAAASSTHVWLPMNPAPPVTRTLFILRAPWILAEAMAG